MRYWMEIWRLNGKFYPDLRSSAGSTGGVFSRRYRLRAGAVIISVSVSESCIRGVDVNFQIGLVEG